MSRILELLKNLVFEGDVIISVHAYDELSADSLTVRSLVSGMENAVLLENYPNFNKGPCVLVLQYDKENQPVHAVWGIARGTKRPAVLVTAYRPDPDKWSEDFRSRK